MDAAPFARNVAMLRVSRLVRGRGERGTLEPYHDRVGAAINASMTRTTIRSRHGRLAVALESSDAAKNHPVLLVRHLEAAEQPERAAAHAAEAADRAAEALAFDRAAMLYRAALRLGSFSEDDNRALQLGLARALASAGRGAKSGRAFLRAAKGADAATRIECQREAAEQFLISGYLKRGIAGLRALLAEVGTSYPETPRAALASLLWQRARVRMRGLRWTERDAREIPDATLTRIDIHNTVAHGLGMVNTIRGAGDWVRETQEGQFFVGAAIIFEGPTQGEASGRGRLTRQGLGDADGDHSPLARVGGAGGGQDGQQGDRNQSASDHVNLVIGGIESNGTTPSCQTRWVVVTARMGGGPCCFLPPRLQRLAI